MHRQPDELFQLLCIICSSGDKFSSATLLAHVAHYIILLLLHFVFHDFTTLKRYFLCYATLLYCTALVLHQTGPHVAFPVSLFAIITIPSMIE